MELGFAGSGCQTQAATDFTMGEAIDIMQQHDTSFGFGETAQGSSEGYAFSNEKRTTPRPSA